jgi:hypothetical protein
VERRKLNNWFTSKRTSKRAPKFTQPERKKIRHYFHTRKPKERKKASSNFKKFTAGQKMQLQKVLQSGKLRPPWNNKLARYLKTGKNPDFLFDPLLTPQEQAAIQNWLNTPITGAPPGTTVGTALLSPDELAAYQKLAANQPLTPDEVNLVMNSMSKLVTMASMTPAVASALIHGLMNNLTPGATGGGNINLNGGPTTGNGGAGDGGKPIIGLGPIVIDGDPIVKGPIVLGQPPVVDLPSAEDDDDQQGAKPPPQQGGKPPPQQGGKPEPGKLTWFSGCHFQVENKTAAAVQVKVQYYAKDEGGKEAWHPADPDKSEDALDFTVQPGATVLVKDEDWPIVASRVRVWAESDQSTWHEFKGKDLWLVPKDKKTGRLGYYAKEVKTVTFTIK